ncbi:hypothetical protein AWB71_03260 [Caballeronia peredens]|nr:hypothetical protein AWB71_03260 [Caballeronia peredens]
MSGIPRGAGLRQIRKGAGLGQTPSPEQTAISSVTRVAARYLMVRETPRPRGSDIGSGVSPSMRIAWMSPLKPCIVNL